MDDLRPPNERAYRLARALLAPLFRGWLETRVRGREHLPPPGEAVILTTNHTSALDLFVVGYVLGRPGHFVAKAELLRLPLLGSFFASVGAIPARRDQSDLDVLRRLRRILESGGLVGVAPEGTRSRDGRLRDYDPGFAWLAARTGAWVVPCAIHGAYQLMPKGALWPRRGTLWVAFGAPERYEHRAGQGRAALEAFADHIRDRTRAMLVELAGLSGLPLPEGVARDE